MTNYSVQNVDEFIADSLPEAQPHLKVIRAAVKSQLKVVEEKVKKK